MAENPCGAGYNSFCITPEGNLIPCCSFHTILGSLKEESIAEITKTSKELIYWRSLSVNDYEECGKLDYCDYCSLCAGNNFIEHGTPLRASEINCFMAKTRHRLAEKMKSGYDPLNGKTLRERLSILPDYAPIQLKRENSLNYSDTRLKVGG
jgi:radical SAM protein with 4Fe4S-binding SPASM domain